MRVERVIALGKCYTPDEVWYMRAGKDHWYNGGAKFAVEELGTGAGSCLVIGSPIFEADALADKGWDVTYTDIRIPPWNGKFVRADCSNLPFEDKSFDAVSSSCVLCHVGLGRYNDPIIEDGDEKALAGIARILRGKAAITLGPVADLELPCRVGNAHRVYTLAEARRMIDQAGLKLLKMQWWDNLRKRWSTEDKPSPHYEAPDYLSVLVSA